MSKREKLLEKIRNNPRTVRFEDVDSLPTQYGFLRRQPRSGSSHYFCSYGSYNVTIARHKPYVHFKGVKEVLSILDEIHKD
ncbi:MAG TPA: hypothetical protein VI524_06820 [Anaerolineales bacterium]|nr:hypothetical protein [Anaerolineales bacterium]